MEPPARPRSRLRSHPDGAVWTENPALVQLALNLTSGVDHLTGSSGNDIFTANEVQLNDGDEINGGNDTVWGSVGQDTLSGGLGRDTLTGGIGRDAFLFDTKPSKANIDKIVDFLMPDDTIHLAKSIFKGLAKKAP